SEGVVERRDSLSLVQIADLTKDYESEAEYVEQTKTKKKTKKTKSKAKSTKTGRRTKKTADASGTPGSWRGRGAQPKFSSTYSDDEPAIYEVDAAVIHGRNRNTAPARRPRAAISEEDDEIINITDVTSDASGGFPSETEFDRPDTTGEMFAQRHEWSDSNMLGDDSNMEQEEERYLVQMSDSDLSSSSLSDLDDARLAALDSEMFSGDEGDTESDYSESEQELT
ncbi:hypothetical protein EC988_009534, partial [Linderina pennispora]